MSQSSQPVSCVRKYVGTEMYDKQNCTNLISGQRVSFVTDLLTLVTLFFLAV